MNSINKSESGNYENVVFASDMLPKMKGNGNRVDYHCDAVSEICSLTVCILSLPLIVVDDAPLHHSLTFPFSKDAHKSHCTICAFLQHGNVLRDVMQIPLAVYHLLVSALIIQRR